MVQLRAAGRQPRGWEKIVSRLVAQTDRAGFCRAMLDLQCKIVAAEYGILWVFERDEPTAAAAWPAKLNQDPTENAIFKLLKQAAKVGFERQISHVLKIEDDKNAEGVGLGAHVFVTVMRGGGKVEAISVVVADCRDAEVMQSTAPLRELAAGLFENFQAREDAEGYRREAEHVRQAMALLAVSQDAEGFAGAALNLVNELARQWQCSRVSLGWVKGQNLKIIAISDTEHLKRHSEQVALVELAMAECLDQQQPILYPVLQDAEPLLAHAVVHAHRRVMGDRSGRSMVSIPLRNDEDWLGVLTLERSDMPFDAPLVQQLQLIADLIAPYLLDRQRGDRWLFGHALHSAQTLASYAVGPRHVTWKILVIALIPLVFFAVFGNWPYRVSSQFTFEAHTKRILPAPYQGRLQRVLVEPAARVKVDQMLAELDTRELNLERTKQRAKLKITQQEKDQAQGLGKTVVAQQAQAAIHEIAAEIKLLEYKIEQATIRSPIAGHVLRGYWHDNVGSVIEKGKVLFEVARLDDLIAVIHVNETDIDHIHTGQTGHLATRSVPERGFKFTVTRIVPLAMPVGGANVVEVHASLENPDTWLRPGMQGLAKIDVGSKRIAWIATHRMVDWARLIFWW